MLLLLFLSLFVIFFPVARSDVFDSLLSLLIFKFRLNSSTSPNTAVAVDARLCFLVKLDDFVFFFDDGVLVDGGDVLLLVLLLLLLFFSFFVFIISFDVILLVPLFLGL